MGLDYGKLSQLFEITSSSHFEQEYMWAVVFATSPATVTLGIGSYRQDFQVGSGITKLKIGLQPGQMMVQMVRSGQTVIYQSPSDFTYSYSTDKCGLAS